MINQLIVIDLFGGRDDYLKGQRERGERKRENTRGGGRESE